MQNFETNQEIYANKLELLQLLKHPCKGLAGHYLATLEYISRDPKWFTYDNHRVPPNIYRNLTKNTLTKVHRCYETIGTIIIRRGACNQVLYEFPWQERQLWPIFSTEYIKLERSTLRFILEKLSNTEINLFIALRLYQEESHTSRMEGDTFSQKKLREYYLNMAVTSMRKTLNTLASKNLLPTNLPSHI